MPGWWECFGAWQHVNKNQIWWSPWWHIHVSSNQRIMKRHDWTIFFFKRKKYLSLLAVRLLKSGERSMIKIYRHWHAAITQRHCRILSRSGFPPCSLPLRLATGLLLMRVRLFIRLCNCTQSGRWWLMCEIITRSSVDGMRALRSRTSPIWLSLVYILILAPAWPLRLRVNLEDAIK